MMPTCVELFAGAGGAALGLHRVGFEHLALCEWDKDACATLRAAGLGPVLEGDVREQDWDQFRGQVDMLWSSFPCQAFSTAGKRDGANDERNMWPATMDTVDDCSPAWFIAENVPGLTYHRTECEQDPSSSPLDCPGCYFERIILMDLADRFDWVEVWKLDAADFGVPQHRRRIFMVAGPHYVKRPIATHCDPRLRLLTVTGMSPWVSVADALGFIHGHIAYRRGRDGGAVDEPHPIGEPACALRGAPGGSTTPFRVIGGGQNPSVRYPTRTYRDITDEPSTTVAASLSGTAGPFIIVENLADEPAPTVVATTEQWSADQVARERWEADTGRRRLTVEECAILQAFPPDHPFQGTKCNQYRQIGNAVPPPLAEAVAAGFAEALTSESPRDHNENEGPGHPRPAARHQP